VTAEVRPDIDYEFGHVMVKDGEYQSLPSEEVPAALEYPDKAPEEVSKDDVKSLS